MANNIKFKAPVLPTPPQQYNQSLFQRTFSVLRLYFNQIDNQFRENLNNITIDGTCDITGNTTVGGTLTVAGATTLNGATTVNNDLLKVVSTDAGATENPILALYRNSASVAASDEIGAIEFRGNDGSGSEMVYANIYSEISVIGSGSEQANLNFGVRKAGGFEDPVMRIRQYAVEILDSNTLDFARNSFIKFEGSNANNHETSFNVVDPTQDNTINLPDASGTVAIIDSSDTLEVVSTDAGADSDPTLSLYRNSASPAVGDDIGKIKFYGNNDAGTPEKIEYAGIYAEIDDETDGTEDGELNFYAMAGGSMEDPVMRLDKNGLELLANNDLIFGLNSNIQFEGTSSNSNDTTLFCVDPTQDNTVLLPNLSGTLPVLEASNSATYFEITNDDAGATAKPVLSLYRNSASPATNDDMGAIRFFGNNASGEKVFYAGIDGGAGSSVADGSNVGKITFYLSDSSSSGSAITDPSADITDAEDPVMTLYKYGLVMRAGNDIHLANQHDCLEWSDTGSHDQKLQGRQTETSGGDSLVSMPDANQGVLEIGALGTGAVVTGTSITHANFTGYRGQKVVFTGSSNCTIQLPDVAAGDVGATWTVCNAGSANVIFDLNGSGSAQTLKILTGAAVTTVGTDDPHIIPGGVASLVCTAADNYILFGSGVVDN